MNLGLFNYLDLLSQVKKSLNDLGTPCPHGTKSTLPLTKESVPHNTHLVSEVDMLAPWERLRQNVCYLLIRGNVLEFHNSLLDPISDEVILDVDMLGPLMKHRILRELNTALIVTMNHRRPQLKIK